MSSREIITHKATSASLALAMENTAPHLRPIIDVVRNHGVDMLFVPQGIQPFRPSLKRGRPVIYIMGDDLASAMGPEAFHLPSVRRAIRSARCFAVVSGAAHVDVYASLAITAAVSRHSTLIVETRPEQEIQWVQLIQKLAPGRFIWLATVKAGRA